MDIWNVLENCHGVAEEFAQECEQRQQRREADPADFRRLQQIGVHLAAVPVEYGGAWEGLQRSVRPMCEILRVLAHGDPSVALVTAMHPGVLFTWRDVEPPKPFLKAWKEQRREVFTSVRNGAWWGTIASEPGSGGDLSKTRAIARPEGSSRLAYRLSGAKHFGSGSGITSYMITFAVPQGEEERDLFILDVGQAPWDGSTGMELSAPWDGHGMASTNSHAFVFRDFPATRFAWPGHWKEIEAKAMGWAGLAFTAVTVGIVERAMGYARHELEGRGSPRESLQPLEQVLWIEAEQEAWLVHQAYEAAMLTVEAGANDPRAVLIAKESVARLSESVLTRLCKVVGGSSYSRRYPLGTWYEDARALGFLRPPWGLAYERLFQLSWPEE